MILSFLSVDPLHAVKVLFEGMKSVMNKNVLQRMM